MKRSDIKLFDAEFRNSIVESIRNTVIEAVETDSIKKYAEYKKSIIENLKLVYEEIMKVRELLKFEKHDDFKTNIDTSVAFNPYDIVSISKDEYYCIRMQFANEYVEEYKTVAR